MHSSFVPFYLVVGVVAGFGGQFFLWNGGLIAGFGSYFIATFVLGLAYVVLIFSVAEMTSVLPFAGGAFGFSRLTHGTYLGFLVGVTESLEYVVYVSVSVIGLGQMLTNLLATPKGFEPLWWAIFYMTSILINVRGGKFLWGIISLVSFAITGILITYCVGTAFHMDVNEYATWLGRDQYFRGGMRSFVQSLPFASWFFIGAEALPMACEETIKVSEWVSG